MRDTQREASDLTLSPADATPFRVVAVLAILIMVDGSLWHWAHNPPNIPKWLVAIKYAVMDAPLGMLLYAAITLATTGIDRAENAD